jgi:spore germination protein YaaH
MRCSRAGKSGRRLYGASADINKTEHALSNIALKDVYDILKREKIEKILFDDRTQLCFVSYITDGQTHNVLFEDYRSLYAKARLMQEKGVGKIIFPGLSYETVCLCGILDMLEYATDMAGV